MQYFTNNGVTSGGMLIILLVKRAIVQLWWYNMIVFATLSVYGEAAKSKKKHGMYVFIA